jgi:hypothetical protein
MTELLALVVNMSGRSFEWRVGVTPGTTVDFEYSALTTSRGVRGGEAGGRWHVSKAFYMALRTS